MDLTKYSYSNIWDHPLGVSYSWETLEANVSNVRRVSAGSHKMVLEHSGSFGGYMVRDVKSFRSVLRLLDTDIADILEAPLYPHWISATGVTWQTCENGIWFVSVDMWLTAFIMAGFDVPRHARYWYEALPIDHFVPCASAVLLPATVSPSVYTIGGSFLCSTSEEDFSLDMGVDIPVDGVLWDDTRVTIADHDLVVVGNVQYSSSDDFVQFTSEVDQRFEATDHREFRLSLAVHEGVLDHGFPTVERVEAFVGSSDNAGLWNDLPQCYDEEGGLKTVVLPRTKPVYRKINSQTWLGDIMPDRWIVKQSGSVIKVLVDCSLDSYPPMVFDGPVIDFVFVAGSVMATVTAMVVPEVEGAWVPSPAELVVFPRHRTVFIYRNEHAMWEVYDHEGVFQTAIVNVAVLYPNFLAGVLSSQAGYISDPIWALSGGTFGLFIADHVVTPCRKNILFSAAPLIMPIYRRVYHPVRYPAESGMMRAVDARREYDLLCCCDVLGVPGDVAMILFDMCVYEKYCCVSPVHGYNVPESSSELCVVPWDETTLGNMTGHWSLMNNSACVCHDDNNIPHIRPGFVREPKWRELLAIIASDMTVRSRFDVVGTSLRLRSFLHTVDYNHEVDDDMTAESVNEFRCSDFWEYADQPMGPPELVMDDPGDSDLERNWDRSDDDNEDDSISVGHLAYDDVKDVGDVDDLD